MDKQALAESLDRAHVKQRSQAGFKLSYIEAWHAISEANRIFGFDGWTRTTDMLEKVSEEKDGDKWRIGYIAKVTVTVYTGDHIVTRQGTGGGNGINRNAYEAHEIAAKEAESDAMKRALMTFGNPFGLALYDKSQSNVELMTGEPKPTYEQSALFTEIKGQFESCESQGALDVASSEYKDKIKTLTAQQQHELREVYKQVIELSKGQDNVK